ncbi:arginyltransferase [Pseudenhygromyxa sp. WMMC2535]|uniref:arginyltransferase n=1 Tax=Pseudenhygromyxa sp. WMMC2535 TaxID=2712867 RepID=UPI0015575BEC|nr:arginyltransferase [Pseudenhygromyxa sp. WMMC2535]NVB38929.1 arginyltransferase [Pseudenhygromyxa sp. WMMC2535]
MSVATRRPRLLDGNPPELLVYDEDTSCPYLEGRSARLPMRLPTRPLTPAEFSQRLRVGDRRQGLVLYRPACPACTACEAIRLDLHGFRPNKTQRRVHRRGRKLFRVEIGRPRLDSTRVELYNRHKIGRELMGEGDPIDETGYGAFLVDSCTESFEMRYFLREGVEDGEERLVGVAVIDQASDALSAVYTYFDPDVGHLSPGVFSILEQLELCRSRGLRWLYLGLYVANCPSMAYKARYVPHERLLDGRWVVFDRNEHGLVVPLT